MRNDNMHSNAAKYSGNDEWVSQKETVNRGDWCMSRQMGGQASFHSQITGTSYLTLAAKGFDFLCKSANPTAVANLISQKSCGCYFGTDRTRSS